MKKISRMISAVLALMMVSNFLACSQDPSEGTASGSDTTHGTDTTLDKESLPPLGDLDVAIDKTPLNPDMSDFVPVSEALSVQEKPSTRVLTDYSETKKTYAGAICVVANNSNVWVKDGKYTSDYKFVWDGSHILGPAPTLAAFANLAYAYDEATQTVTIGHVTAKAGQKYIVVDGKRYESESENTVIDGVLYLPLREFVRYGMKKFYGESTKGFAVIATEERPYHFSAKRNTLILVANGEYSKMMAYLVLDRYNAATLWDMFEKNVKDTS